MAGGYLGDIKDPELAEKTPVEDKKTGEVALRDAIWVKTGGLKRENFEEIRKSKSASKQFTTDKVTAANMQAIVKRVSNFAAGLNYINRTCSFEVWSLPPRGAYFKLS